MAEIVYKEESYRIIGVCMKVHKTLGEEFLEAVYQEALEKEFREQQIPFESQKKLSLFYDGQQLKKYYKADFLCFDKIIVEIKSVSFLNNDFRRTLFNYLKATQLKLGLLINFGNKSLEYKRILNPSVPPSH
ncbi:MAG: GxxExxY protein [Bacteroidota bacterium]|nr:GxxExxY protein [Bacteroidota bacterium]